MQTFFTASLWHQTEENPHQKPMLYLSPGGKWSVKKQPVSTDQKESVEH